MLAFVGAHLDVLVRMLMWFKMYKNILSLTVKTSKTFHHHTADAAGFFFILLLEMDFL